MVRGLLYFVFISLIFYLILVFIEYFGTLNVLSRTIVFWTYIISVLSVLVIYVIVPLLKVFNIGSTISYEYAARIIGNHFPEIDDKLLNTIQLGEKSNIDKDKTDLLIASIDNRVTMLTPFPFKIVINIKKTLKYIPIALIPLITIIVISFVSPSFLTEPTERIINYSTFYQEEAAFEFIVENESFEALQNDDYMLNIKVVGEELPNDVYIVNNESKYKLNKEDKIHFTYTIKNINSDFDFYLEADDIQSKEYKVSIVPKPSIISFKMAIDYPAYTGIEDELRDNSGDIIIPNGTKISWAIFTKNTSEVHFTINNKTNKLKSNLSNSFTYNQSFRQSCFYSIKSINDYTENTDSLMYNIGVIPDIYPKIDVKEQIDSTNEYHRYFKGDIDDDYGFSKLVYIYYLINEQGEIIEKDSIKSTDIPINSSTNIQEFYHMFDLSSIGLEPGMSVEYYFEVWDNDAINGAKSTKSNTMRFAAPNLEQIKENSEKTNKFIKDDMSKLLNDLKKIQEEIDKIQIELLEKNDLSYQDKQKIENLIKMQEEIEQRLENIKEENTEKLKQEEKFNQIDQEILDKQRQLEKMFNELFDDQMKELFKELEQLIEEVNKEDIEEKLKEIDINNDELKQQLDRNLELFKQLEFEQKLQENIDNLQELAEEQRKLAEETLDNKNDKEELEEKQNKLNKEFENIREDIEELNKLNDELEEPNTLDETEQKELEIKEEMKNSSDKLNKNSRKKANQSQESSAEKIEKLSKEMESMQQEMAADNLGEDIESVRKLLTNLIQLSLNEEKIINIIKTTDKTDPKYIQIVRNQKNLNDQLEMVKDSLIELSKRQMMISTFVNQELAIINSNTEYSMSALHERQSSNTAKYNQNIMTSINNLALMLNESLNQMMAEMASQMQESSCKNCKGGGKPKPGNGKASSMKEMQKALNQQMEALKKELEGKGKKQGEGAKGSGDKGNKMSTSEEFVKMAAQQEAIRKMMQDYAKQLKQGNTGNSKEINRLLQEMEQTEIDLVNKTITQQTINRQRDILTRLLEHENAELEREKEEKRESNEAINPIYSNPKEFFNQNSKDNNEDESLKYVSPSYNSFYKSKINEYFYKVD